MSKIKQLVFATQNIHKVEEIQKQLKNEFQLQSLLDLNHSEELEETQNTLEGNALQKARFVYNTFRRNCFADDTGLEIEALNGAPGVNSAYYSGERDSEKNIDKVLQLLRGETNRNAQFKTVISLILDGVEYKFEGVCKGIITQERKGSKGFGYDPIFQPLGYEETFAEMSIATKNKISHRGVAVQKLVDFLNAV